MVQLSHPYMSTGKTIALTKQTFVGIMKLKIFVAFLGWVLFLFGSLYSMF